MDIFSKSGLIRKKLLICPLLLNKFLAENFIWKLLKKLYLNEAFLEIFL